jgi:hypothetical protein
MTRYEAEGHLKEVKEILKKLDVFESLTELEKKRLKDKARSELNSFDQVIHFVHDVED